jgi:hypothetical protein
MPWRIRVRVNWVRVWEAAQRSDARVKTAMAEAKTVRAPNRSATQPEMGMNSG